MTERTVTELSTDDIRAIVREELQAVLEVRSLPEWMTLRQAAELKGVSYDVLRKRSRRYWPAFGVGHPVVSTGHYSKMYHRSEVLAWLPLTEAEIDELWRQRRRAS